MQQLRPFAISNLMMGQNYCLLRTPGMLMVDNLRNAFATVCLVLLEVAGLSALTELPVIYGSREKLTEISYSTTSAKVRSFCCRFSLFRRCFSLRNERLI